MKKINFLPLLLLLLAIIVFFKPFLLHQQLPIPSDTIIGLYHPFRDLYVKDYPNGIPYKNFLITDPVRQQYPWRSLSISSMKQGELPVWNPYTAAGTPLLANFQSAAFYPLNIILFVFPFAYGWSFLIFLQPVLAGSFLYFYLYNLRLKQFACLLGALSYSFSGFFIAWLEWGVIGHTALWLPLLLLAIDKIFASKFQFSKKLVLWSLVFVFSLVFSFLAGHLQTFIYLYIFALVYFLARWVQFRRPTKYLVLFLLLNISFFIITAIQWISTIQFIGLSARSVDQIDWQKNGWFIPWEHLIQFVAPDFFGNPTTLNYWGTWNYGELVGYIGILPFIMAIFALFFRRDKKTFFFSTLLFLSLLFSLPTYLAKLPYILEVPFLSTTQPTRLLLVTDFTLAVLAAFGFDYFLKTGKKIKILYAIGLTGAVILALWLFVFFGSKISSTISAEHLAVAKRNLYIPTFFYITSTVFIIVWMLDKYYKRLDKLLNRKLLGILIIIVLMGITIFDLLRFSQKFTPFTASNYLFPSTKALNFLQNQTGQFRIMSTDSRILPPNFSVMYNLQSLDSYDPLYLLRYGELIAAINRNEPDNKPPFGFNRIITPQKVDSRLIDLLGVQFILSLTDLDSPKLQKVFAEGQTRIYMNTQSFPRVFTVESGLFVKNKEAALKKLFDSNIDLRKTAILETPQHSNQVRRYAKGKAEIITYSDNKIIIKTDNVASGFLVLMDSFYPSWKAKVCNTENLECTDLTIHQTNYNFRGVETPKGTHHIVFYSSLL